MKSKLSASQVMLHIVMIIISVLLIFPVIWMVSSSLKLPTDLFSNDIKVIPNPVSFDSYRTVLHEYAFTTWFTNSFVTTAGIFVLQILVSLTAAFALGYYRTRWNQTMFYFLLLTMVIPFQVTMIPNYVLLSKLGAINTWWGVILPYAANASTFFFLYQNVRNIPRSYYEVAHLEGASSLWIFRNVMVGLCKGAISAISILTIIDAWNLYFWPLLVMGTPASRTLTIALRQFTDHETGSRFGPFMATATLASLPVIIVYLFFQRNIIDAFISSGIKG